LPNDEHVDAAVRELFEEIGLTLTVDDLTLLSGNIVILPLCDGQYQLVYVFSAFVHVTYVTASLRTATKVKQVVTAQSTIYLYGYRIVPTIVDI
jgi:8-oxo-dGTP pyrophosphatase MutT (NUDIX family)